MTAEMEEEAASLKVGKVPGVWLKSSYPTLKPLASFVKDLSQRLDFIEVCGFEALNILIVKYRCINIFLCFVAYYYVLFIFPVLYCILLYCVGLFYVEKDFINYKTINYKKLLYELKN